MKRFKYSLENVLHYKEQILDSIHDKRTNDHLASILLSVIF